MCFTNFCKNRFKHINDCITTLYTYYESYRAYLRSHSWFSSFLCNLATEECGLQQIGPFVPLTSCKAGRLRMASKSIASALTLLTSEQFTPSDLTDNNALEAFVMEYFTGSGEITDNENSDDSEGNQEVPRNRINYSFR